MFSQRLTADKLTLLSSLWTMTGWFNSAFLAQSPLQANWLDLAFRASHWIVLLGLKLALALCSNILIPLNLWVQLPLPTCTVNYKNPTTQSTPMDSTHSKLTLVPCPALLSHLSFPSFLLRVGCILTHSVSSFSDSSFFFCPSVRPHFQTWLLLSTN